MAWQMSAPVVLDALVTLAQTLPDIDVADGQKVSGSGKPNSLVIGYSDQHSEAIEHTLNDDPAFVPDQLDRFTVNCRAEALVTTGSTISAARVTAYGLVASFAGLIYADPTLGIDAVMQAVISDVTYATVNVDRGHFAIVRFGVACEAYTGA